MGGCERIFRTPIPLSYTRHTSRFLVCWLTLLPFCVADAFGWLTVPISIGLAFFLFGIEVRISCWRTQQKRAEWLCWLASSTLRSQRQWSASLGLFDDWVWAASSSTFGTQSTHAGMPCQ